MSPVILFDFDGTIADSMDAAVTVANRLSAELGTAAITPETIERWRQLPLLEVLNEANISLWQLPQLLRRVRQELRQEMVRVAPIPGMADALKELQQAGFQMGIVTSNSTDNVETFLRDRHLAHYFEIPCTEVSIFGKRRRLKRYLHRQGQSPADVTYIGDEARDIQAARANGIRAIAVTWGFSSRNILADADPDGLANHPSDLLSLVSAPLDALRIGARQPN
ncbi:MAG: HAD-IA family hydrolase [Cyanobacteria bacterium P01_G01_bin.4]